METTDTRRNEDLERRWDRVMRWSLVASVLFHILLVLWFRQDLLVPTTFQAAAGERKGDPKAAAGGGAELIAFQIEMPPPVPEEIPKPPDPVPVPDAVEPEVEPEETAPKPSQNEGQQTSAGEGRGRETGPGTETGTGQGDGGTADEGLYRLTAPSPRGMILPPSDRPGRVKGKTVTVYVFVNNDGGVVPDSTRLAPPTGDARFDRRLRDDAAQWKFRPGMRGGQPIATWFPYTITF